MNDLAREGTAFLRGRTEIDARRVQVLLGIAFNSDRGLTKGEKDELGRLTLKLRKIEKQILQIGFELSNLVCFIGGGFTDGGFHGDTPALGWSPWAAPATVVFQRGRKMATTAIDQRGLGRREQSGQARTIFSLVMPARPQALRVSITSFALATSSA